MVSNMHQVSLEGADMMIVKPALSYLDIVRTLKTIQIFLLLLIT